MPIVTTSEWSNFYSTQPQAHILQSASWGELKSQFGWNVFHFLGKNAGAQVLIRDLPLNQRMAYIPKGPIGENWEPIVMEIDSFCHQKGIAFLKIEPDEDLSSNEKVQNITGLVPSPQTIQPRRTLVIDLRGSPESILGRMKQKTRYNINLAQKRAVRVRPWTDLRAFHRMMLATGERDTFGVHSSEYYETAYRLFHSQGNCELLAADHEDDILAALMVFKAGSRAWYFYGASGDTKRNLMPTYLLQWEAMLWAKEHGCNQYDLWGVPDFDEQTLEDHFSTRNDGLWGVYRFKRGFGGSLLRSKGAYDRVYQKTRYAIYRAYCFVFRHADQS